MVLAMMLETDENALICDLAETYHLLDYRALPVDLLATLCCGLRDNSRIKMKMAGLNMIAPEFLLIHAADSLSVIRHGLLSKKNAKMPSFWSDILTGAAQSHKVDGFDSGEDFEKKKKKILSGG